MINPHPGDEDRSVFYWQPGMPIWERECGTLCAWDEHYLFVRYTTGIAATRRGDLHWDYLDLCKAVLQ